MSNRGGARLGCADFRRSLRSDRRVLPPGRPARRRRPEPRRPAPRRGEAATAPKTSGRTRAVGHHPVDARRAEPHRHVGPEARRPGRVPRRVRRHPDERARHPALRPAADVRQGHGQVVDRPQPAPPRRRATRTGDQICFTGYNAGPEPRRERPPELRLDRLEAARPPDAAPAGLRDDPADGARAPARPTSAWRTSRSRRRPTRPAAARSACRTSSCPRASRSSSVGDRRALLTELRHACAATSTPPASSTRWTGSSQQGVGHPDVAGRPRRVRPRPRADERSASATASCRRSTRRRRTAAAAPAWSQRILLARRLVEAGVRLVTVDLRWWDTHVKGFESLRLRLPAALGPGLHGADRGPGRTAACWTSTLVLAWGEFGRTPQVNNDAGRDHYPNVFSAALAGGPVKGGRVVGESDAKGAFPKANPKTPQDVLATMYSTSASTRRRSTSTAPAGRSRCCPPASRSTSCAERPRVLWSAA